MVVLPTPPFGAKTRHDPRRARRSSLAVELLADAAAIRVIRSKPEKGIERTPWIAVRRVGLDRVLGHGQDDDRDAELGLVDLLDELQALDPALEQRVDEDDVRAQLARSGASDLRAVGQDVEQLDLRSAR